MAEGHNEAGSQRQIRQCSDLCRFGITEAVNKENIEDQIATMLALTDVNYINIRNAEAGCFVARIERS